MNEPPSPSDRTSLSLTTPRLAPSTLGEILDRTIQLYRSRFLLYLGISLVPTAVAVIPACGVVLFLAWAGSTSARAEAPAAAAVAGFILLAVIGLLAVPVLIATFALTLAAMPCAASRDYLGEKTTIREAYKSVWHHGWRYSWLLILEGLIVGVAPVAVWIALVAVAAGLAAIAHLSGLGGGALIGLATFLAVVALTAYFFWMLLRLSLAFPACVIEQIPATRALKRSSTLSTGTKGRIFLLYLLVGVLNWILSMGVTLPLTIVMTLLPGANDPKNASTAGVVLLVVIYAAAFAIQALTRPIYGIALTLFYYDQRIRQEGFDIEWMMQRAGMAALAPAQPPPPQPVPPQIPQVPPSIETPSPEKGESL
jgi:Membrane domain of glycerophosphoryl diester phosphodiesterase